jgi:phosphoribosyl 1,2-cyclic phosphodiesterase
MIARFWGVRGSVPTSSIVNMKYGGNTPCLEVRTVSGQLLIFDAGTGIRALGKRLKQETPPEGHRITLFLSHYHWDHIQGIPFFEPLYDPSNYIYLHGYKTSEASIERALVEQMVNPFFPVDTSVMRATRHFYNISEETLQIGEAVIHTRFLNHPQGCMGYRIEADGQTLVYATDNEHGSPLHDRNLRDLAQGADVMIYDAQYTADEYLERKGWGHSTWEVGVQVARAANVKQLVLFHHDPDHSDAFVDNIVVDASRAFPAVVGAMEGMELDLSKAVAVPTFQTSYDKRYASRHALPVPVVLHVRDAPADCAQMQAQNLSLDGAYVHSPQAWEIGRDLDLELQFAGATQVIHCKARVMRCDNLGDVFGIGVSFR